MTDLMEVLYTYVEERMLRGMLDQVEGYADASIHADWAERKLRGSMGEEGARQLEDLIEERKLMAFFEGQAMFRAGFQIAMELTR